MAKQPFTLVPVNFDPFADTAASNEGSGFALTPVDFDPFSDAPRPSGDADFTDSLGRGVGIAKGMGYGFVEATGELVGSDTLKEFGKEGRVATTKELGQNPRSTSFQDINSFGDAIDWTKETVGEQLPMMAPGMVGGIGGAALGAASPIPGGALIGGVIGAFVPSLIMGTGETQMAIKEKDPNAEAPGMAFLGGSAIAALDSVLPGKIGSRVLTAFGREAGEDIVKKALTKRIVAEGVKGMTLEGATEAVQEAVGEAAAAHGTGQEIDWSGLKNQMIEAAAAGAFMGGGASVTTEIGTAIMRSAQPEPTGKREQATREAPDLTDADRASPIPDDLISEGKAVMKDGEATQSVNEILTGAGVPKVNGPVTVQVGENVGSGVIADVYENEQDGSGVKIVMEDGSTFVAPFDKIASQDVLITPELPVNPAKQPEAAPLDQVQPQVVPEELITAPEPVLTDLVEAPLDDGFPDHMPPIAEDLPPVLPENTQVPILTPETPIVSHETKSEQTQDSKPLSIDDVASEAVKVFAEKGYDQNDVEGLNSIVHDLAKQNGIQTSQERLQVLLRARRLIPHTPTDNYVRRKDGTTFKTEKSALMAVRSRPDLKGKAFTAIQVEGGWALQEGVAEQPVEQGNATTSDIDNNLTPSPSKEVVKEENAVLKSEKELPISAKHKATEDISSEMVKRRKHSIAEGMTEEDIAPGVWPLVKGRRELADFANNLSDKDYYLLQDKTKSATSGLKFPHAIGNTLEPEKTLASWQNHLGISKSTPKSVDNQKTESVSDKSNEDVVVSKSKRHDSIIINSIKTPEHLRGQGLAEKKLIEILAEADAEGLKVALSPSSDFGASKIRLEKWYRRHGFVRNTGKNKDFSVMESMIRPAQKKAVSDVSDNSKSTDKIEDFGEKIHGARKDMVTKLSDTLNDQDIEVSSVPLSKSFPRPNFEKLAEEGVDQKALAYVAIMRDEIPNKPRASWKLGRWVKQVSMFRELSGKLISGNITTERMDEKISSEFKVLQTIADTAEAIKGIDPSLIEAAAKYRIRSGSYLGFAGEKFKGAKSKWTLESNRRTVKNPFHKGEGYGGTHTDSIEDMIPLARKVITHELANIDKAEISRSKYTKVDIRQDRNTKDIFIALRVRGNTIRLKTGFEDVKSAREYRDEHRAEIQKKIDDLRGGPEMRRGENRNRAGKEHRDGDISSEMFSDAFGFRGVQFGNYVESDRRQTDLNHAFDALMDLADTIGVPAKAISLNGELGLAFGARGKGGKRAALAHYEPGQVVINLTKTGGPGSLAHEWLHALDNYFARQDDNYKAKATGKDHDYMSSRRRTEGDTRDEVYQAWKDVQKTLASGGLTERSAEFDLARSKPYWNTTIEKAARAFEKYMIVRLAESGAVNDYLANIDETGGAYPTTEEMKQDGIKEAFDNLFNTIETRETDKGVEMFSLHDSVDPDRMIDVVDIEKMPVKVKDNDALQKHLESLIGETALDADAQKEIGILARKDAKHVARSMAAQKSNPRAKRRNAAANVLDLLYSAVYVEHGENRKQDKKPTIERYHRFYVPVLMNGEVRTVRIVAEEKKGEFRLAPDKLHVFDVVIEKRNQADTLEASQSSEEEIQRGQSDQPDNDRGAARMPHQSTTADLRHKAGVRPDKISIRDMLAGVKDMDGKSYFDARHRLPDGANWVLSKQDQEKLIQKLISIHKRIAPKSTKINVVKELFGNVPRRGRVKVSGVHRGAYNLTEVAVDYGNPEQTVRHEGIHALKNMGMFTTTEWNLLANKAKRDWIGRYNIERLYPGLSKEAKIEEAIAQAFAEYESGGKFSPTFRRVLEKIKQFLQQLKSALNGMGFNTVESIFDNVESGKVSNRDIQQNALVPDAVPAYAQDNKYSLIDEDPLNELTSSKNFADQTAETLDTDEKKRGALRSAYNNLKDHVSDPALPHAKDLNWFTKALVHPRTIAETFREFAGVWLAAEKQFKRRDTINAELTRILEPYHALEQASKSNVHKVLEIGRLEGQTVDSRMVGMTNKTGDAVLTEHKEHVSLNEEESAAYHAVRESMDRALNLYKEQVLREWGFGKKDDPATSEELIDHAKELNAEAKKTEDDAEGKELRREANIAIQVAQLVEEIEKAKAAGYIPFSRFGNVSITVRDKGNSVVHFEKIEVGGAVGRMLNKKKVHDIRRNLLKKYPASKGYEVEMPRQMVNATDLAAAGIKIGDVDALAELARIDGPEWESVRKELNEASKKTGFRKHFVGAKNTKGYSGDFERSIADYVTGISSYLARREVRDELEASLAQIPSKQVNLRKYAEAYEQYIQSPGESLQWLRSTNFFYYLSGNLSSAIVNLTQIPLATMPYLSQFASTTRVNLELAKAYKDTAKMTLRKPSMDGGSVEFFDPSKAPEDVREALQTAWDDGTLVPMVTLEQMGVAHGNEHFRRGVSNATRATVEFAGSLFTGAERANRIVTFIAAHRLARQKGVMNKAHDVLSDNALWQRQAKDMDPAAFAEWVIDETHFVLGKRNRPTWFRGIGTAVFQFKGFGVNYLELMWRMAKQNGPEGRKGFAMVMGALVASAGVWGLPFGDDLKDLIEGLYAWAVDKEIDLETEFRQAIYDATGSATLAEAVNRGALRMTGADVSRRLSMGSILPVNSFMGLMGQQTRQSGEILGVPWDMTVGRIKRVVQHLKNDDGALAASEMLPNFAKNPVQAIMWSTDGVRSRGTGRAQIKETQITNIDVALKSIGFTPVHITREREAEWAKIRSTRAVSGLQKRYYSKIVKALVGGDKSGIAGLMTEIKDYNQGKPLHEQIIINRAYLNRLVKQEVMGYEARKLPRKVRAQGLKLDQVYPTSK